jgi:hypothetical protein
MLCERDRLLSFELSSAACVAALPPSAETPCDRLAGASDTAEADGIFEVLERGMASWLCSGAEAFKLPTDLTFLAFSAEASS